MLLFQHGLIKGLWLLSTFSTNIHENQRQKQTVVPAWRRKSISGTPAAYTTPITTYVRGLHFNNKQNRTDSAGVIKGKNPGAPPTHTPFSARQIVRIQESVSPFCEKSLKDQTAPSSTGQARKESARDVRTSITCLFTFGWHTVDPGWTYTERAVKKASSSCWPSPSANRLPSGH